MDAEREEKRVRERQGDGKRKEKQKMKGTERKNTTGKRKQIVFLKIHLSSLCHSVSITVEWSGLL